MNPSSTPIITDSIITIVIPTLNEEKYIRQCLHSVLDFEKPKGWEVEILVLDGKSRDRTVEISKSIAVLEPRIEVIENPGKIQSCAMNIGISRAKGQWIMRLDAHAIYPRDYLLLCYETAKRTGADNVGGVFITEAGGDGYSAHLVQALTTHKFGVGDSGFRTGEKEDWADTVPYGFYRRAIFDRLGGLDERLVRAQDYEFNRRIIVSGGKILRNPLIQIRYFNQPTLGAFYKKQVVKEAPYNAYLWYLAPYAFAGRHAVTGLFATGVLGGLLLAPFSNWIALPFTGVMALYLILAVLSGFQQAVRYRKPLHAILLPFCFFLYHFIHGIGILYGLLRLATGTAPVQQSKEPWPGAGYFRWSPELGR